MTDILALDIATTTGYARGIAGETPIASSIRFGKPGGDPDLVFRDAILWISGYLKDDPRPDTIIIEALLPAGAMQGETTRQTRDRLAGLHACMRGTAKGRGIKEIAAVSVGDVRAHFIGDRTCPSARAKTEVMRRCRALGWEFCDDNAADALAVWSFGCALVIPEWALKVSPLFNRSIAL